MVQKRKSEYKTLTHMSLSKDRKWAATGSGQGRVTVLNTSKGMPSLDFNAEMLGVKGLALSPDGNRIATFGIESVVKLWDSKTGRIQTRFVTQPPDQAAGDLRKVNSKPLTSVAFSPDGKLLAVGGDGNKVIFWDTTKIPKKTVRPGSSTPSGAASAATSVEPQDAVNFQTRLDRLKQLGLAFHDYHEHHGSFPSSAVSDNSGTPLLSWRVLLLPQLGQQALFDEFHLDEPWDSEHNKALLPRMPIEYSPNDETAHGSTRIQVFTGRFGAFGKEAAPRMRDFLDGTSQTLLAIEAGPSHTIPWTQPRDLGVGRQFMTFSLGIVTEDAYPALYADGCRLLGTLIRYRMSCLVSTLLGE
jgi:hypothetical protein